MADIEDLKTNETEIEKEEKKQYGDLYEDENLAIIYGDRFEEATNENPYYKVDKEFSERINKTTNIVDSQIDTSKLDLAKLREFTNEMLEKVTVDNFINVNSELYRKYKQTFKKSEIYYMYCLICQEKNIPIDNTTRGIFQSNSFRSQSGVMVYAVFTHPFWKQGTNGKFKSFSCKYDCRFCPEQPGHARSYVDGEPGEDRARGVGYDTIKQVYARANSYEATGHINDKAEVIVLGGTWHSYPLDYRREFITLLYKAFNTIHENRNRKTLSMEEEIKLNENSKCRVIGLTIETRPDQINPKEILELRKMGVTRIQLGIQHTNDRMLERVQRQCSSKTSIDSIKLLKDSGFKVDMHLMPDLPKPFTKEFMKKHPNTRNIEITKDDIDWSWDSVGEDLKMFNEIFHKTSYCPDQVKIYPCAVMDYTKIKDDFDKGLHVPYGTLNTNFKHNPKMDFLKNEDNPLIELLINVKSRIPPYVRINRLIRDIPSSYILGGISDTSGRQRIEKVMKNRHKKCNCIRCREIKKKKVNQDDVKLEILQYTASDGFEYFFQYVTKDDELVAFLRLRLSKSAGYYNGKIIINELVNTALIRELHVYGETVQVNRVSEATIRSDNKSNVDRTQQHVGYGSKLLNHAFAFAFLKDYKRISVISGEGVKPYYRRFGFYDGEYYLIKDLNDIKMYDLPQVKIIKQYDFKITKFLIVFFSFVFCLVLYLLF